MNTLTATPRSLRTYRAVFAIVALSILGVPLVAMQFSREVNWQAGDFLVFAAMLLALGAMIELAIRYARSRWMRSAVISLSLAGFVFVWAMLATAG